MLIGGIACSTNSWQRDAGACHRSRTLAALQCQLDILETERFELSRAVILAEADSRPVRVRKLVPEPAEGQKTDTSP